MQFFACVMFSMFASLTSLAGLALHCTLYTVHVGGSPPPTYDNTGGTLPTRAEVSLQCGAMLVISRDGNSLSNGEVMPILHF